MRWPGNVRELLNTVRRAAVWSEADTITETDIAESLLDMPSRRAAEGGVLDRPLGEAFDLQALIADVARHYLVRAMEEARGNKTTAAKLLGLPSYQTLSNWLARYGVAR